MLGHRELTIQDYIGILKRRLWLVLLSTLVFLGAAVALTFWIPPQYMSQTLVLIEQQKVPTDYVTPVLTEDLNERLASLRADSEPFAPGAYYSALQPVCGQRGHDGRPRRSHPEGD